MTQTSDAETTGSSFRTITGHGSSDPAPPMTGLANTERRYRRRPALIGLGVGLLAVCGAGAAYLTQLSSDTVAVLAVASDVHRGEAITESDLTVAYAAPHPAISSVAAGERDNVVGRYAAADLTAGSLLVPAAVTTGTVPGAGQTVVGVALTEVQMPQHDIVPGDPVRIFDTPNPGDEPPSESPRSTPATVVSVSEATDSGKVVVDVVVDDDVAGELVARVATGRVAIVLDSVQQPRDSDAGR